MERHGVLGIVNAQPVLIQHETERLQQMRDNASLGDPRDLPVFTLPKSRALTPHLVQLSSELIIRNAALKAIGDCDNYADETEAKANIAEAQAKLYETGEVALEPVAKKTDTKPTK